MWKKRNIICLQTELPIRQNYMQNMPHWSENMSLKCKLLKRKITWRKQCDKEVIWIKIPPIQVNKGLTPGLVFLKKFYKQCWLEKRHILTVPVTDICTCQEGNGNFPSKRCTVVGLMFWFWPCMLRLKRFAVAWPSFSLCRQYSTSSLSWFWSRLSF